MTFEEFAAVDNDLRTSDDNCSLDKTNDVSASDQTNDNQNEDDDDDDEVSPPKRDAVLQAFETLTNYTKTSDVNIVFCEYLEYIKFEYHRKNIVKKRQLKIDDFFKK